VAARVLPRLGPLSLVAFRRVALANVAAYSAIVVTGAAVRLTDSGLGCPDWPTCAHHRLIAAASVHQGVEAANRAFSGLVALATAAAVVGALLVRPRRRDLLGPALGLVAGFAAQVVLGGLTVLFRLYPPLVMAHLLVSLAVLACALVLLRRSGQPAGPAVALVDRDLVWLSRLVLGLLAVVVAVGTAVTGSGPHAGSAAVSRLPFPFHQVAEVHASLVWLLVGVTVATLFALHQAKAPAGVQRRARVVLALMVGQGALGYAQYLTRVPALLVGFHVAGATALWVATVWYYLGLHARPPAGLVDHRPQARAMARA
jgi:cytochrome c oxidase assembly protein subunit 15